MENIPNYYCNMDANLAKTLITRMRTEMEVRNISVPKLSEEINIPKDRIYKWFQRGSNGVSYEDAIVVENWINPNMDNVPNKKSGSTLEPDQNLLSRLKTEMEAMASNLLELSKELQPRLGPGTNVVPGTTQTLKPEDKRKKSVKPKGT